MVIIFSSKECALERQLADILISCGAEYISDSKISSGGSFTAAVIRKDTELSGCCGIGLMLNCSEFSAPPQSLAAAVCEGENHPALRLLSKSGVPVISCGMGSCNTVTLSSISGSVLVTLQRSFTDLSGASVMPGEYKITLKKEYSYFAVMAAFSVLLLHGIIPSEF